MAEKMQTERGTKRISYNLEPDYTKPLDRMPSDIEGRLFRHIVFLYGEEAAPGIIVELKRLLTVHCAHKPQELCEVEKSYDPEERFTEKDVVLIAYGDIVHGGEGQKTLSTLYEFVNTYNRGFINTIHILPFFPYTSDRGFSVIDYLSVDPRLGSWDDIIRLGKEYNLMFDGVFNHVSSQSRMFKSFLNGHPFYKEFFIAYDSPDDLTPDQRGKIFRPRTTDILTRFYTIEGIKYVWTTFSDDQIDLNFRNPYVLLRIVEALLFYVRQGANIIRLDAVTYIWAEPGTECVHLPETHEVIKLLRSVLDAVAPGVALLTETNVPHEDNVSYFGNGYDQAHMVYNFALPPLILFTFYTGDATILSQWAGSFTTPSGFTSFFNILDTHDGIGLMGAKGILFPEQVDLIIRKAILHGAHVSYKGTEEKKQEPYEINSTWWSALNGNAADESLRLQVSRFLASRSIALALKGIPGLYVHGIIGTENDPEIVRQTGSSRDINRQVIEFADMAKAMEEPESKLSIIAARSAPLYNARIRYRAFHPRGEQLVPYLSPDIFVVLRTSPEGNQHILAITNITDHETAAIIPLTTIGVGSSQWFDLLSGRGWEISDERLLIELQPYEVIWLIPADELQ